MKARAPDARSLLPLTLSWTNDFWGVRFMTRDKGDFHAIDISKIVSVLQAVILLATVATVFMSVGAARSLLEQNTESIDELRDIASDLVKAGVMSAANDERHDAMLSDLKGTVERKRVQVLLWRCRLRGLFHH